MSELPTGFEVTALVVVVSVLLADLLLVLRRPHVPSTRESATWVGVYIAMALAFGGLLALVGGGERAGQFLTGWLVEYSLSLDNLFVFTVLIGALRVPGRLQQRVLMIGILIALVVRGALILAGTSLIDRFTWIFYLFGIFLVVTAIGMLRGDDDEEGENGVVTFLRRYLPIAEDYDGSKLLTRENGRRVLTPLLLIIVALGLTDVLFAFDSIPVILFITQDPFLVIMATVFALMGLRQLYFLLGALLDRLVYLKVGLAILLAYIGVGLILRALHENSLPFLNGGQPIEGVPEQPEWLSLVVIVVILGTTALLSLWRTRGGDRERGPGPRP